MYRVRTVFSGVQGSPWLSTFYFDDSGGTAQQAATAAGDFWNAVDVQILGAVTWTTQADVSTFDPITGILSDVTITTPATGIGGGGVEPLPFANQGLVRWRTGAFLHGRELRGRTFIPGVVEAANSNGQPLASWVTAVNAACAALVAHPNAQLMVWQRPRPAKVGPPAVSARPGAAWDAQSGSLSSSWAVLRSRRD